MSLFVASMALHYFHSFCRFQLISLTTRCSDTCLIVPSHSTNAVGMILISVSG